MSLFGALISGVSGLKSQGSAIAVVSDNISNLNTVGYKRAASAFATLVNNAAGTSSYNPGGVFSNSNQLLDQQGLLQATSSPTDMALSGGGLFVVNSSPDGNGSVLYTRAGSFTTDDLGNFINNSGFYLQGWPVDASGRLPGAPGNLNTTSSAELSSLETVNLQASTGAATATTEVDLGANLDASQTVFPGAGATIVFQGADNTSIASDVPLVPVPGSFDYGDTFTVTTDDGFTYTYEYGGIEETNDVTGGIFSANTISQPMFTAATAPTGADATFTITTTTAGTVTFTYRQSSPNPFLQQFNSLNSLANAIDEVNGLQARVANNILYITPDDADEIMTFANGGATTDWLVGIGLTDTAAPGVSPRFGSLKDLATKVNNSDGITAETLNATTDATVTIRTDNPLGTITFDDIYGAGNYNMLIEMGIIELATDSRTFGPVYDQDNALAGSGNMASGELTPHFSRNFRIFDALGTGHNFTMAFIKIDTNTWAAEVFAADENDINAQLADDQIARGTITFNGDGTLASVSSGLINPIDIEWLNGATASAIEINWGTAGQPFGTLNATDIGLADGLSQFDANYNVSFVAQNGAEVGSLTSVTIDADGYVIANYSNGEAQKLYKLPLADFAAPNQLQAVTGNVYQGSDEAGVVNLREAGTNGVGTVVSGALETSNVELAEELTNMIVSQRAYQASAKVIKATDELLQELNNI